MEIVLAFIGGMLAFAALLGCQYLVAVFAYNRQVAKENGRIGEIVRAFDPRTREEQARIAAGEGGTNDGISDLLAAQEKARSVRSSLWGRGPRRQVPQEPVNPGGN